MQTILERLLVEAMIIALQFALLHLVSWLRERLRSQEDEMQLAVAA